MNSINVVKGCIYEEMRVANEVTQAWIEEAKENHPHILQTIEAWESQRVYGNVYGFLWKGIFEQESASYMYASLSSNNFPYTFEALNQPSEHSAALMKCLNDFLMARKGILQAKVNLDASERNALWRVQVMPLCTRRTPDDSSSEDRVDQHG